MLERFTAIHLAPLCITVLCSIGYAGTPLAITELDIKRRIADAEVAQARAENELAEWRLAQLEALRVRGHASWQEVAEQEVVARSAEANADATEKYLQAVLRWQARADEFHLQQPLTDSETIKLYLPQSTRLAAWIPVEVASSELLDRHLENLCAERQALANADVPSMKVAIEKAKRAVEVYSDSEHDADLLSQAEIRLRLAEAKYKNAGYREKLAEIIDARIALVRQSCDEQKNKGDSSSLALAQAGTRFVDATSDDDLALLVKTMAADQAPTNGNLAILKHRRKALLDRIDALKTLVESSAADPAELAEAEKQNKDLAREIQQTQDVRQLQQEIAKAYLHTSISESEDKQDREEWPEADTVVARDASTLRHMLQLQQLELQTAANRAAIGAQHDYMVERLKRVERIPEAARPPKEVENLRHSVQEVRLQLATVDRERNALECEQQRFCLQTRAQQGDQYQLVQAGDGEFIPRLHFEMTEALVAAIGFVGTSDIFLTRPATHPYLESTLVHDSLTRLSLRRPSPTGSIYVQTAWGPRSYFLRCRRSSVWRSAYSPLGLHLATDGITHPLDRYCYHDFGLRRSHLDYRWSSYDYLRPSVTCGVRSHYPYGSYAFGLSRPSHFSSLNRFPDAISYPHRSRYVHRSAIPRRSILDDSRYRRLTDPY